MFGLGKMGYNLALNIMRHGHELVVHDIDEELVNNISKEGAIPSSSADNLLKQLESPRIIWLMIPAGDITDAVIDDLRGKLDSGDIIIDGGNSNYQKSIEHGKRLKEKGIHFFDCGTSGGVEGAKNGICAMIGGD